MINACNQTQRDTLRKYIREIQANTPINEFAVCAHFACGKKLTRIEGLAGSKCTAHIGNDKVDVMKVLKFK